jgi:cytoskeletal protein RodZ
MLTPGQILQKRRKELKKSLSVVSQETRIQERFLKYIEADDYARFDSGVFVNGFIKIYADYLGLDVERMLALYRRASKQALKKISLKRGKVKFDIKKYLTPVNAAIALVGLALIAGLVYLSMQFYKFQTAPELEITSPENNAVVEDDSVLVKGIASDNSEVSLNGETVELGDNGSFEKKIELEEGENTITVEAINLSNEDQKTVETIRVEYREPEEVKGEETQEEPTVFQTYLEIVGEETWVQFVVDSAQKYAQVLPPGRTDIFEMGENVEVVTGKPQSTKLYINGKLYPLNVNPDSGVASISCTVKGDTIDCSE